jgi:probable O-glycosylation ligase (exosortase A-associated)
MLRIIFVSTILIIGVILALQNAFNALLLYLWIGYFRPETWVWTEFFYLVPTSFVVGAYLLFRSAFSGVRFRFDFRAAVLAALLIVSTFSTFTSDHFEFSIAYQRDFAKTLVVSYLISVLTTDLKKLRLVFLTICLSLAFESAKQGWAQLILNPGGANNNMLAILGDNNAVAVGMLMLVPMLIALARTASRRWERWGHYFLTVGIVYRAISTYSRGGFLALAALGLMHTLRSPYRVRTLVAAALVAVLTLSVMPDAFWDRMSTITVEEGQERDVSAGGRIHFWRVALLMAQDQPLTGIGINAYTQAYSNYDTTGGAFGFNRSVHSAWMGILSELGYPGFVLFVTAIVLAFAACRRARRLAKKGLVPEELGHYGTAIEAALVAFSVGSTFVIFQYVEMLWHVIGLSTVVHYLTQKELAAKDTAAARQASPSRPPDRPVARPQSPVFNPRRPRIASLGRVRS